MTILRPPRREPRALALVQTAHGIAFAVVDPWELRSCGVERCGPLARQLAIRRIIRREKPTVVTANTPPLIRLAGLATEHLRVPVVVPDLPLPPSDIARDLVRGMAYQAPTRVLQKVVGLALATVLHSQETHRTHAPRIHPTLRRAE
jgi:hypothetical protein